MKRRLLFVFLLFSSVLYGQNNIYRSGGITQTIGAPTFTPGASGNVVAIDTVTGEWYVNPNRLSGSSWISAGYRLTNISGSVPPAYTPTTHQSHFVVNAANQLYYWDGAAWQTVGGGGGGNGDATRLKFVVVNKSGGTLNKGEVVYVSGAQGNRVAVKKALASQDSLSANTLGVMDETVLNNNEGYCVAEGLVSGINTSAFTEGAALYLSPTTAGAITQTKTTAPDHLVLIGYCVKSSAGSGEISVHIQNGYELGELHDVYVPSPTNGQVLTYNTTNTRWESAAVADQSATNEIQTIDTFSLSGQTLSASLSSDGQAAKTVTLPVTNVTAGTGISVSSTTGNYTVTNSAPDQTVSITNGGGVGVTGTYPSFTLTATDQSITNEIQRLDTFSLSGQSLRASLSSDNQPAKVVTLPVVGINAGTNVTVSENSGVYTINASGGITSLNSLTGSTQTFATGTTGTDFNVSSSGSTHTFNLPTASATNRGALSSSDWSTFNNKANSLSGVTGYVSQFNSSNTIDTTGLFWNQSNGRLGIGTTTPSNYVNIVGRTASDRPFIVEPPLRNGRFFVESRGSFGCEINATGAPTIRFSNSNPSLTGLSMRAGSIYDNNTLTAAFNVNETLNEVIYRNFGTNPNYRIASMNNLFIEANSNLSFFTNGTVGSMTQRMTINNSGNIAIGLLTPSARLHVSSANTTAGVGAFLVEDGATTPAAIYRIDNDGKVTYRANAISGTTGNQTINTPSGNVNFAAGATSLTVTNSLCTSSSLVFATVRTNDSTAYVKNVVPGAGSFTINLEAAATAETSVGFFIIN